VVVLAGASSGDEGAAGAAGEGAAVVAGLLEAGELVAQGLLEEVTQAGWVVLVAAEGGDGVADAVGQGGGDVTGDLLLAPSVVSPPTGSLPALAVLASGLARMLLSPSLLLLAVRRGKACSLAARVGGGRLGLA